MGEILMVLLPAAVLVAVIWAVSTALRPRDSGTSDAERYQQDLARRSAEHYAEQVRVATAARARLEANTRPSQNEQQQTQQEDHARAARALSASVPGQYGYTAAPGGALNPQLAVQLQTLARNGHKIEAIRLLRKATQTDLAAAKKYVDRL